jgi:hypothetical protein
VLTSSPFAVLFQQLGCRLPKGILQRVIPRGTCLPPAVKLSHQPCQVASSVAVPVAAAVVIFV